MKSKISTRSILMLALTSFLVLQVIRPVNAVPTTTGYVTVWIVNTNSGRGNLVGTTGATTFTITDVSGQAFISVDLPALKSNLYKFFNRNYGTEVECIVSATGSTQVFFFAAPHGPKRLQVYIQVDSLAGYSNLHFQVSVVLPAS